MHVIHERAPTRVGIRSGEPIDRQKREEVMHFLTADDRGVGALAPEAHT